METGDFPGRPRRGEGAENQAFCMADMSQNLCRASQPPSSPTYVRTFTWAATNGICQCTEGHIDLKRTITSGANSANLCNADGTGVSLKEQGVAVPCRASPTRCENAAAADDSGLCPVGPLQVCRLHEESSCRGLILDVPFPVPILVWQSHSLVVQQ